MQLMRMELFCSVLVIDQDDNYVSFVGEGTFDEENGTVTITDEVSEMALTFGVAVNDDDTLTLDMGDLGSATVEELRWRLLCRD